VTAPNEVKQAAPPRRGLVLASLMLSMSLVALDSTIVATAAPN
jgi:hypothetical protein